MKNSKLFRFLAIGAVGVAFSLPAASASASGKHSSFSPSSAGYQSATYRGDAPKSSSPHRTSDGSYDTISLSARKTASRFYERGVKRFEADKLLEAEKAFHASLEAEGEALDKFTYHYLVVINYRLGDLEKAEKYMNAYKAMP